MISSSTEKICIGKFQPSIVSRIENAGYNIFDTISECDNLSDVEFIVGRPDKNDLCRCSSLKWLQLESSGTNGYENKELYAQPENVILTTASGVFGVPISEYIIGSMLLMGKQSLCNHIGYRFFGGGVRLSPEKDIELTGSNVMIFGCGDIGRQTAKRLVNLGCAQVIGVNRTGNKVPEFQLNIPLTEYDRYVSSSDFIISAMPENEQSIKFWDMDKFKKMKDNCIFINVGRASAVVEEDLVLALKRKIISGAVLDVCSQEPISRWNKLRYTKRLLLTNHSSHYSNKNNERLNDIIVQNIELYLSGKSMINVYQLK